MESNQFICRGISVDNNEFVFGYYFYNIIKEKHYILNTEEQQVDGYQDPPVPIDVYTEIIQEPDKVLYDDYDGIIKDKNGKLVFEKDKLLQWDEEEIFKDGVTLSEWFYATGDWLSGTTSEDIEIIGNTHFNNNLTGE